LSALAVHPRVAGEALERVGDRDPFPQVEAVTKLAFDVIHRAIAGDLDRVRRNPDDLHHLGGHDTAAIRITTNAATISRRVIAWGLW
jgi:hypothetical protein